MLGETKDEPKKQSRKKPRTLEGMENQLIALAYDRAYEQLVEGTASSQVITHFLKLGTTRERIEKEILAEQKKLLVAKTDAIKSQKDTTELYMKALEAMKTYSGGRTGDEDD